MRACEAAVLVRVRVRRGASIHACSAAHLHAIKHH